MNSKNYHYSVHFSARDDEWVATCDEFPSLSALDYRACTALIEIQSLVADMLFDMECAGEAPPLPHGELTELEDDFVIERTCTP